MGLANKLSSGGFRSAKHKGEKLHHYVGRFTTAGAAAATDAKGRGYTVHRSGTGRYLITLDRCFAELVAVNAWIDQATAGNDFGFADPSTFVAGDADTAASFTIETQSAAGTAANLTGPVVCFEVWASDKPTRTGTITSTSV